MKDLRHLIERRITKGFYDDEKSGQLADAILSITNEYYAVRLSEAGERIFYLERTLAEKEKECEKLREMDVHWSMRQALEGRKIESEHP